MNPIKKSTATPTSPTFPQRAVWSEELLSRLKSWLERQLDGQPFAGRGFLPVSREDLVGEVLLRLLVHDPREIQSPFAYARTILRNLIRDKIRELERAQKVLERLANSAPTEASPEKTTGGFESGELLRCLFKRTKLSALQKKVIQMVYFEGMKISEVARVLSVNPGTVYRHHDRAIQKLTRCAAQLES